MKFLCRTTDHELSHRVLDAFAEGTPRTLVTTVGRCALGGEIPVYYGILRGCKEDIHADMLAGRPWVYIDHGYFGDHDNATLTGHYRIVVGGLHHRVPEWPEPDDKNCLWLLPSSNSRKITQKSPAVLVPPSPAVADFYGIGIDDWIGQRTTAPPVVVSTKATGNLKELMKTCRLVVSHSSTASVMALVAYIPASCTAERAPVPNHELYERDKLLCWLLERQFTLEDIRNGRHLKHLRREVEGFEKERAAA